jgi:hypothetical protein
MVKALCNSISADHIRGGTVLDGYDLLARSHLSAAICGSPGYFALSEGEVMGKYIARGLDICRAIVSKIYCVQEVKGRVAAGRASSHICCYGSCRAVVERQAGGQVVAVIKNDALGNQLEGGGGCCGKEYSHH